MRRALEGRRKTANRFARRLAGKSGIIPAVDGCRIFLSADLTKTERAEEVTGLESEYAYWVVTGAVGVMVGTLAWFVRRLIAELEAKIERGEKATRDQMDALQRRMDKQEERYDRLLTILPDKYALRDDLIRMSQNIEAQLGQIRELIVNGFREKEGNG